MQIEKLDNKVILSFYFSERDDSRWIGNIFRNWYRSPYGVAEYLSECCGTAGSYDIFTGQVKCLFDAEDDITAFIIKFA